MPCSATAAGRAGSPVVISANWSPSGHRRRLRGFDDHWHVLHAWPRASGKTSTSKNRWASASSRSRRCATKCIATGGCSSSARSSGRCRSFIRRANWRSTDGSARCIRFACRRRRDLRNARARPATRSCRRRMTWITTCGWGRRRGPRTRPSGSSRRTGSTSARTRWATSPAGASTTSTSPSGATAAN